MEEARRPFGGRERHSLFDRKSKSLPGGEGEAESSMPGKRSNSTEGSEKEPIEQLFPPHMNLLGKSRPDCCPTRAQQAQSFEGTIMVKAGRATWRPTDYFCGTSDGHLGEGDLPKDVVFHRAKREREVRILEGEAEGSRGTKTTSSDLESDLATPYGDVGPMAGLTLQEEMLKRQKQDRTYSVRLGQSLKRAIKAIYSKWTLYMGPRMARERGAVDGCSGGRREHAHNRLLY